LGLFVKPILAKNSINYFTRRHLRFGKIGFARAISSICLSEQSMVHQAAPRMLNPGVGS
jgi:hypothetical protein